MAFLNLVAELSGTLPGLSPLLAQTYINRAWQEIREARLWSFLVTDGVVVCPTQVTEGTAAIVQYSPTVTLDAAASAALLPQTAIGAVPGLTNLQIRFGASSPAIGQVYSIVDVDTTTPTALVLTLNRMVVEATNPTAGYQVYRPYITPPVPDFLKWVSLIDMVNAFAMTENNGRLSYTSTYFDARDPQRQAQGFAYFCGSYAGAFVPDPISGAVVPNPNVDPGSPVYELWPHPTSGQTFYVRFRRQGQPFAQPSDTQPSIIPDGLIIQRALGWHAYPFALANIAHFPTFKGVNWMQLITTARAIYQDDLLAAKRQDDEQALQTVWNRGHGLRAGVGDFKGISDFPIDSNFLQSHLVRF